MLNENTTTLPKTENSADPRKQQKKWETKQKITNKRPKLWKRAPAREREVSARETATATEREREQSENWSYAKVKEFLVFTSRGPRSRRH